MDSLSFSSPSLEILIGSSKVDDSLYEANGLLGSFIWKGRVPVEIECHYRLLRYNFNEVRRNDEYAIMRYQDTTEKDPLRFSAQKKNNDIFGGSQIDRSGSISRGVSIGNNQDLAVNSDLNLQLSGKISDEISILASVSDNNIPIQPQGNTQQLQDFDQVYIQLFTDKWKITAGDYWMKKPRGYFMKYNKKVQGGAFDYQMKNPFINADSSFVKTRAGVAISKGKFGRNVIQGIENNQGPYRLIGADGEPFIIVLSGTEVVYIDGKLMTRGQENDYVIDYNSSEITFTAKQLITKDKRITVEFQYSDKNYARSILESNTDISYNNWDFHLNVYSEQDARNQPLQQLLDEEDQSVLIDAGDDPLLAFTSGIDSLGFDDNSNKYEKLDSLGYEIYRLSVDADLAYYQVIFTEVGQGLGNYIQSDFNAFGKVYEWVAPDTVNGVLQKNGSFEPIRLLVPPKQRQMVSAGIGKKISKGVYAGAELVYTKNDLNTFSNLDSKDDEGYGATFFLNADKKMKNDWLLKSNTKLEYTSTNFQFVERYRAVEFTRNWNVSGLDKGNQILGSSFISLMKREVIEFRYGFDVFNQDSIYKGIKNNFKLNLKKWLNLDYNGSYLITSSSQNSNFYRHKSNVFKEIGKIKIGYQDELEQNLFYINNQDSLNEASYQFFDYQFYASTLDSAVNKFKVFYRERSDQRIYVGSILNATKAINPGLELSLNKNKNQQFSLNINYRRLLVSDTSWVATLPEETILGRLEHRSRFLKGGITSTMFYEVGSGLELRREFAYLEVPAGQGVYTWVDYNNDGIKDINEFEIAQYTDQATYIRISTPSNDYVKVFSNQFSEVLNVNFRNIFKSKKPFSKFIGKFKSQSILKVERKTSLTDLGTNLNPFTPVPDEENLQSIQQSFRQSTYFNRTGSVLGLEHTFIGLNSKSLLSTGFDQRTRNSNEFKIRINATRKITIQLNNEFELKGNTSDYTIGRDYLLTNYIGSAKIAFQPNTAFRISLNGAYKDKKNDPSISIAEAYISEVGLEGKWNQVKKGSLNGNIKYALINYNGVGNTSLSYEMLESLQPGNNMVWSLGYQRTFANNLQLTINYTGRSSEGNSAIHSGGMQLRAFF